MLYSLPIFRGKVAHECIVRRSWHHDLKYPNKSRLPGLVIDDTHASITTIAAASNERRHDVVDVNVHASNDSGLSSL